MALDVVTSLVVVLQWDLDIATGDDECNNDTRSRRCNAQTPNTRRERAGENLPWLRLRLRLWSQLWLQLCGGNRAKSVKGLDKSEQRMLRRAHPMQATQCRW